MMAQGLGDSDGVPGSWLQSDLALVTAVIGISKQKINCVVSPPSFTLLFI